MSRVEFMKELATLLEEIPLEERQDALIYYEDYFDEAGALKEQEVIKELGSPEAVATIIKENLETKDQEARQETRTEEKAQSIRSDNNKILKIIVIVLIIIVGSPIIVPVLVGALGILIGLVAAMFGVFLAMIITAVSLVATGLAFVIVGGLAFIPEAAAAIVLMGIGLAIMGIGLLATYGSIKLCLIVFPSMARFVVSLIKRPFQRKAVKS